MHAKTKDGKKEQVYAIIQTGGKQYRVEEGDIIDIELVDGEPGSKVQFSEVLFVNNGSKSLVGGPFVSEYIVTGEFVDLVQGPKISCIKYIPGNHRRTIGHRQKHARVKIVGISSHKK